MVTDLGYLGARHPFRPWMAHGVCHNLVMVDGADQKREPGELVLFQPGECVQAVVAEAPATYPQCSRYERTQLLITPAAGVQYVADVFRVSGGKQHDFAFHGDGEFLDCPQLADARPLEIPVGPKEGGYDWLEEARSVPVAGEIVADWRTSRAASTGVRLRMLGATGELISARGPNLRSQSQPYAKPMLDYVIQRRPGPDNTFVSVVEPLGGAAVVTGAQLLATRPAPEGDAAAFPPVAMRVNHSQGSEIVLAASDADSVTQLDVDGQAVELTGRLGVVSLAEDGQLRFLWIADGASLTWGDVSITTTGTYEGSIVDFSEDRATFTVDADLPVGSSLAGQPIIA